MTLIVLSDHGGQEFYGEDKYCIHGCPRIGKDAFLYMSNHEILKKIQNETWKESVLNPLDISSMIIQTIKSANIPLFSSGTPASLFSDLSIFS